jgi:hypothetical protein
MSTSCPYGKLAHTDRAVTWLAGTEELAGIRPRPLEQRQLFLTSVQRNAIFFSSVIFLPLLLLVAGGLVWWGRR